MKVTELKSKSFGFNELQGKTVLAIGAPYIGKSHLFCELEAVERKTTLPLAMNSSDKYVVIDEFYRAYQAADAETWTEFLAWLEDSDGVCVSARPRAIDWLLEHEEPGLTEADLDVFDSVYHLRYDPDSERAAAIDHCIEICGQDENGLDRETISGSLDSLTSHQPVV